MIFSGCRKDPQGAEITLLAEGREVREASRELGSFSARRDRDLSQLAVFDAGDPTEALSVTTKGPLAILSTALLREGRWLEKNPAAHVLCFSGGLDDALLYSAQQGRGRVSALGCRSYSQEQRDTMRCEQRLLPLHELQLDVAVLSAVAETQRAPLWVSINLDVLAPPLVPGVTPLAPGGASFELLQSALEMVPGERLIGFEITGYPVPENRNRFTALTAAELMRDNILVWWGKHR